MMSSISTFSPTPQQITSAATASTAALNKVKRWRPIRSKGDSMGHTPLSVLLQRGGMISGLLTCEAVHPDSVAVKLDGVDRGGNGPSPVAAPLLLRLFVAERLSLCELQHLVRFLAPVPCGSVLKDTWQTCELREHHRVAPPISSVSQVTFASKELSARRGSTATSSSRILRNGMLED